MIHARSPSQGEVKDGLGPRNMTTVFDTSNEEGMHGFGL